MQRDRKVQTELVVKMEGQVYGERREEKIRERQKSCYPRLKRIKEQKRREEVGKLFKALGEFRWKCTRK